MRMQQRLLVAGALILLSLVSAQCGSTAGGTSPTSPSPSPSPAPAPAPSPSPTPAGSAGLTVAPQSIQGQGQPQATVTLASAAPDGGALVVLSSSNSTVARVPATVTVAAGQRSVSFLVDTSTVQSSTSVTLTATYGGTAMSFTLGVTSPPLNASFVVRSPSHGVGTCEVSTGASEFDCTLDGGGSGGFVRSWIWTYTVGNDTLGHTAKDAGSKPQIATKCAFLNTATGGDGPNGDHYLNMRVTLQVEDAVGVRSSVVSQAVRLYPNRECGFSY